MAGDCHVLLSVAGPYVLCGEKVVKACIEQRTHYIDLTGEVTWMHRIVQRYHTAAKQKGVMIVQCAGSMSAPDDAVAYLLVEKLGALKQLREYVFGYGISSGGSFNTGLAVVEQMLPDALKVHRNPFSLGGERKCGVRPEDADCDEAEEDKLFPNVWVMPAYTSHTTSRILRRTCALFEETPAGSVQYGADVNVVVRDLALDQKAAAYAVWANPVPVDIKETVRQARTMEEARKRGTCPMPGLGPGREARALGFIEGYTVAEAEDGKWAHVRFSGPDGYEVTAIACVVCALVLLEELGTDDSAARAGVVTPAFACHRTSWIQRLQAHGFACSDGRKLVFKVHDGLPSQDEVRASLLDVAERKRAAGEKVGTGLVHAWDQPILLR